MYITNDPTIAKIAEANGVDRIFVDMEYIGKNLRQGGMDTVQSKHTLDDVKNIRNTITKSELLVRVNPIHEKTEQYSSSEEEIDGAIANGADILMLPYFKTVDEVKTFIDLVGGRAKVMPLLETPEAVEVIDDILSLDGIDEIFIGLNDLSLGYGMKFMFEPLANGTVDMLCNKFKAKGIPYGFGGLASLNKGLLPGKMVLKAHYRLGSGSVILSRSFCNANIVKDIATIQHVFEHGIKDIRALEEECMINKDCPSYFLENREALIKIVAEIVNSK